MARLEALKSQWSAVCLQCSYCTGAHEGLRLNVSYNLYCCPLQSLRARMSAGLSEATPAEDAPTPSMSQDEKNDAVAKVDTIMHACEGALLSARLLLRHAAGVLTYVHELPVAVHPAEQEELGEWTTLQQVSASRLESSSICASLRPAVLVIHLCLRIANVCDDC